MTAKKIESLNSHVSRRVVLKGAAAMGALGSAFPMPAIAQETTWTLANCMRSAAIP